MPCRGVRGATTVERNTSPAIIEATTELLGQMIAANGIAEEDVAAVFFTTTPDLDAAFPAQAARELGWTEAALLCGNEMAVPGSLKRCIRILILWNTDRGPEEVRHVYIRGAEALRPERSTARKGGWRYDCGDEDGGLPRGGE